MGSPSSKPAFQPLSPFLAWPPFLATPPLALHAAVHGLEVSQWEDAAALAAGRGTQLRLLLEWAVNNIPYFRKTSGYADVLASVRRRPDEVETQWAQLPVLTKAELRAQGPRLAATGLPAHHGPVTRRRTSGSTGIPVEVGATAVTRTLWEALTIRDHLWHRRDFSKRLGVIRSLKEAQRVPRGVDSADWGSPVARLFASGPSSAIHVGYPLSELVAWLKRFDPHYLLTYPSVAASLLDCLGDDRPPSLEELRMFSEPLDPDFVARVGAQWQVRCSDVYSANEVGYIALQCPERGRLHVQAESLLVEILDEAGHHCAPGGTGRVVLTPLHNLATPLIRYELGDYATVGLPCPCGRASPVIERVRGRVRNMVCLPDGQRFYPVGMPEIRNISPIRQAQYIQSAPDRIELRVVLDRPLSAAERDDAVAFVRKALGYPFDVGIIAVERIERGPTGKFEEFVSHVTHPLG